MPKWTVVNTHSNTNFIIFSYQTAVNIYNIKHFFYKNYSHILVLILWKTHEATQFSHIRLRKLKKLPNFQKVCIIEANLGKLIRLTILKELHLWMGYSRKNPNRGGWGYTFLKTPWKFSFFTLLLEISKLKQRSYGNLIPRPKTKTLGKPNYFFLVNLGNSSLLLINDPWKFHMLFLLENPPPSPLPCFVFGFFVE